MSFRVNTNVSAIAAHRNLTNSSMSLNQSLGRLSSGLRIVTAADDPAGLVAAENFRAQVLSVDAATRNNQDAINYAKTAEGALQEVNQLLTDARALVIASGNSATLSAIQLQANQDQITSISQSITRISTNTQFGTRKILDGSSGVTGQISNATRLNGLSLSGSVGGASVTVGGLITVTAVTTAATRSTVTSSALTGGVVLNAGSFSVNGVTFSFPAGTTGGNVASAINAVSNQTGVTAAFNTATNLLQMSAVKYGSSSRVNFTDASGVISPIGTSASPLGVDAVASVSFPGGITSLFTGGRGGYDGISLSDSDGNLVRLTDTGNITTGWPLAVGQVAVGNASFQIGANANQTTTLALPNSSAAQLGNDLVAGTNFSTINVSNPAGVTQALQIIDRAIEQVSFMRGRIGQFQKYALESNNRALSVAKENMTAAESSIRDVDMASEMTNFTKLQIMQNAGLSMLGQANNLPQGVLNLLRG